MEDAVDDAGSVLTTVYLPVKLRDKEVIVQVSDNEYFVDNSLLKAPTKGIGYRRSKSVANVFPSGENAAWGSTIIGNDEGDGWISTKARVAPARRNEPKPQGKPRGAALLRNLVANADDSPVAAPVPEPSVAPSSSSTKPVVTRARVEEQKSTESRADLNVPSSAAADEPAGDHEPTVIPSSAPAVEDTAAEPTVEVTPAPVPTAAPVPKAATPATKLKVASPAPTPKAVKNLANVAGKRPVKTKTASTSQEPKPNQAAKPASKPGVPASAAPAGNRIEEEIVEPRSEVAATRADANVPQVRPEVPDSVATGVDAGDDFSICPYTETAARAGICNNYAQGACLEGDTCKLYHDLVERCKQLEDEYEAWKSGSLSVDGGCKIGDIGKINEQLKKISQGIPIEATEEGAEKERMQGVVKTFNQQKGFGFITSDEILQKYDGKDIFVLKSEMPAGVDRGSEVTFEVYIDPKKNQPQARRLAKIGEQPPPPREARPNNRDSKTEDSWKKDDAWEKKDVKDDAWEKKDVKADGWEKKDEGTDSWKNQDQRSSNDDKWPKDEEKRIHPADKSNKAYTYAEFLEDAKGDAEKAAQMWKDSRPEGAGQAQGAPQDDDKWTCPACSFKNRSKNTVCGGINGNLGCKAPRPTAGGAPSDSKDPQESKPSWDNKDSSADWKKDQTWDKKSADDEKWKKDEEKRIHPSDKTQTPYTYSEFLAETKGDAKFAEQMWNEAKPADKSQTDDNWKKDSGASSSQKQSPGPGKGIVHKYFDDKKIGFIKPEGGGDDLLFAVKDLVDGEGSVAKDDEVTYIGEYEEKKNKWKASEVKKCCSGAASSQSWEDTKKRGGDDEDWRGDKRAKTDDASAEETKSSWENKDDWKKEESWKQEESWDKDKKDESWDSQKPQPPANARPGDWACPSCSFHNFASNKECKKCGAPKPEGLPAPSPQPPANARPGDWACPSCSFHNFASNRECKKCAAPKPEGLPPAQLPANAKPGDWLCPSCQFHNFASNKECKKCGAPKPEENSDWDQKSGRDEERRIHPSDKSNTPYTFAEYLEETKGDKRKAEQMWNESKPAEGGQAQDSWGSNDSPTKRARTD